MFFTAFHLTPLTASALVIVAAFAGHRYRRNWQREGPVWKAWVYGTIAGGALLLLAFTPLKTGMDATSALPNHRAISSVLA